MLCESQSCRVKVDDLIKLDWHDARMVKWMSNVMLEEMMSTKELRTIIRLKSTKECFQNKRLRWFDESAWSSKCRTFKVSDSLPRGKPRKTWKEVIRRDLKEK